MGHRTRRSEAPALSLLLLVLAVVVAASAAGCGQATTASPSPATPSSSPSASAADGSWTRLQAESATSFSRSTERLSLPYREYKRSGSWRLEDTTDDTAAFMKNTAEHQQLWLMDIPEGSMKRVFARAITPQRGYVVSGVELSDGWLAWEEVGPGDDLVEPVNWRLYAAPLQRASLSIGKPKLVASASNVEATRPLFDVSGSRLAWISTAWTSSGTVARSQLTVCDLATGQRRALYRSRGVLDTVNIRGDEVIVGEIPQKGSPATRFVVLDLGSGERRAGFEAANEYPLSHWPAWRDGWLAWAPFPSDEATYPWLYLRDAEGRVYDEGGLAVDPCFVGPYLFYQTSRFNGPGKGTTVSVRALRLSDMTSLVLEEGDPDAGDWWRGTVGAPELTHTYISYLDRTYWAERDSDRYTIIRVYRVD